MLSDDQQRQQYDQARWGSAAGSSRAGAGTAGRAARGPGFVEVPPPDLHAELQLDFREAALGTERRVEVQAMDACRVCAGVGAAPGTPATPCSMCKGRREILKRQRLGAIETRNHEAGKLAPCWQPQRRSHCQRGAGSGRAGRGRSIVGATGHPCSDLNRCLCWHSGEH